MTGRKRDHDEMASVNLFPEFDRVIERVPAHGYRMLQVLLNRSEEAVHKEYEDRGYDVKPMDSNGNPIYTDETTNLKAQVIHSQERLREARQESDALKKQVKELKKNRPDPNVTATPLKRNVDVLLQDIKDELSRQPLGRRMEIQVRHFNNVIANVKRLADGYHHVLLDLPKTGEDGGAHNSESGSSVKNDDYSSRSADALAKRLKP